MAAADSSIRKLAAAAAARRHRSRARKDLHDGFSSDEDVCMNEDSDDDDVDDVDVDGALVFGVRLGHTYNCNEARSGVTQPNLVDDGSVIKQGQHANIKEESNIGNKDTSGKEFKNICPLIHGLLSKDTFNLWVDLVQYLVGEVRSTYGGGSSNCSVTSTATNRVHKRSLSLMRKVKRLRIRLFNVLQQIDRPYTQVQLTDSMYVCIYICVYE